MLYNTMVFGEGSDGANNQKGSYAHAAGIPMIRFH